jgi:hypothetical protein
VLLLAALLGFLQELVLLADESFDVRVNLEAVRNRGEILVALAIDLLAFWVEAGHGWDSTARRPGRDLSDKRSLARSLAAGALALAPGGFDEAVDLTVATFHIAL